MRMPKEKLGRFQKTKNAGNDPSRHVASQATP